ncbi:hypothetical protein CPT76_18005 [Paenibacillus sp. AR247]|nr:hypothetical protein CPT76_18005 [Paenibacillus sp. AR247]
MALEFILSDIMKKTRQTSYACAARACICHLLGFIYAYVAILINKAAVCNWWITENTEMNRSE